MQMYVTCINKLQFTNKNKALPRIPLELPKQLYVRPWERTQVRSADRTAIVDSCSFCFLSSTEMLKEDNIISCYSARY